MSRDLAATPPAGPDRGSGTGARGTTTVADRVIVAVAARAAAEVPGIGGGARRVFGLPSTPNRADRAPQVEATIAGDTVALRVRLSVTYPEPVRAATEQVRRHVADRVGTLTGKRVGSIDVTVVSLPVPVVPAASGPMTRLPRRTVPALVAGAGPADGVRAGRGVVPADDRGCPAATGLRRPRPGRSVVHPGRPAGARCRWAVRTARCGAPGLRAAAGHPAGAAPGRARGRRGSRGGPARPRPRPRRTRPPHRRHHHGAVDVGARTVRVTAARHFGTTPGSPTASVPRSTPASPRSSWPESREYACSIVPDRSAR